MSNERSLLIAGPGSHFAVPLARRFAREGFAIGLMGRNESAMEHIMSRLALHGIAAHAFNADFSSEQSVTRAVAECGQIMPSWGCLAYNVKQSHHGNALTADLQEIASDFDSNVLGPLRLARAAINGWDRTDNARIILAGGGYAEQPHPDKLSLSVSKGAMRTLTLAARPVFEQCNVQLSEVVIDGVVQEEGPIYPAEVAEAFWAVYAGN